MVLNVGITSPAFSMPAMTRGSEYARKCVFEAFHSHHCRGFLMNGTGLAYELFSDSTMIFSVYSALNCSTPAVPREKGNFSLLVPKVQASGLNASWGWLGISVPVIETRRRAFINPMMALDCSVDGFFTLWTSSTPIMENPLPTRLWRAGIQVRCTYPQVWQRRPPLKLPVFWSTHSA